MKFIIIVFLKSDYDKICLKFRTLNCSIKGQKVSSVGKGLTLRTSRTKHKNNPREDKNQLGSVDGDLMMNSC